MDKRQYQDKGAFKHGGYPLCDGGCHRGIPKGLDTCPCDCHSLAIQQQASRDRTELIATKGR